MPDTSWWKSVVEFVSVFSTFGTFAVTAVLVWVTKKYADDTQRLVRINEQERNELRTPSLQLLKTSSGPALVNMSKGLIFILGIRFAGHEFVGARLDEGEYLSSFVLEPGQVELIIHLKTGRVPNLKSELPVQVEFLFGPTGSRVHKQDLIVPAQAHL
jgi:hypothetical protein